MSEDPGITSFSPEYLRPKHRNPEHKHYVNEIVDELNARQNGFLIGPFRELEYPLRGRGENRLDGYAAFMERTIEGEFDVMAITNNELIYYEVKTGDRSIHSSRRQYQKALNFSKYNDFELDFNVLATSTDFEDAERFLDAQDSYFTRAEFDEEVGRDNRVDLIELKKSGMIVDVESLFPSFRIDPREPEVLPVESLVEEDYVERDGHIVLPREDLEDLHSSDEKHYLVTPHFDNFYSRDRVDEMVEKSLKI